ncbi:MAG: gliding motility-associated protein GldE [Bacteroidales bacterium]
MDSDSFTELLSSVHFITPTFGSIVSLTVAVFLLFASGFISASEVAFFSLEPNDLKELDADKNPKDTSVLNLLSKPDRLLATILIANNFVNVAIVMLLNVFFLQVLNFGEAQIIQFIFQTVILTFLLLLFGEIMPKIYATNHSLSFSRRSAGVLIFLRTIFKPVSSIMVRSTQFVNKLIIKKNINISMDELSHALELTSHEIKDEKDILEGIINFGDKMVSEIMISRLDMAAIEINSKFRDIVDQIIKLGYSRMPVYADTHDHIKGVLYIKDLLPYLDRGDTFKWQTLIRPAYFVPESKMIDSLLEEFQKRKIHMAIVVDEYGGTAGLVTMEDVLEEIVGDISDEYDDEDKQYIKIDKNNYIFEGKILLNDFYKVVDLDEEYFEDVIGEADTLAGLLLEIKGDFPTRREIITHRNCHFQVMEMDKHRILRIKFTVTPE